MVGALRLLALLVCLSPCVVVAGDSGSFWLHFPGVALKRNTEFIEGLRLTVTCAHIEGIESIPQDWSVSVIRMIPGEEVMKAEAGHGASRLAAIDKLNGAVKIIDADKTCFSVEADFTISGENNRKIVLSGADIDVRPSK